MIKSIKKRDGRIVLYDESKIASAILKAMEAAGEGDASDAARVANDVQTELEKLPEDERGNPAGMNSYGDRSHSLEFAAVLSS